jgi:transcriptional regulator with XRE-family HTH domain
MATRNPETNPAAFLGSELRRARIAAGFGSQDVLAARLGFERSVLAKAETGERPPSADVLSAWCDACQLDPELFGRMVVLARRADGPIPEWFTDWLEAERAAHTLRIWSLVLVPGLLQTADYAKTLFLAAGADEDEADAMTDARLERQAILDRPDPPHVIVVLDEAVLHRPIGSTLVMTEQLLHLATMAERKHISIHVLPSARANAGLSGAFDIASEDGAADTLRVEGVEDVITQNRPLVRKASVIFDLVRRDALPREPSRALIQEAAEQWKAR